MNGRYEKKGEFIETEMFDEKIVVNKVYLELGFTFSLANCTETCECMGPDQLVCGETPFGCQKNRDSCVTRDDGYFECAQRLRVMKQDIYIFLTKFLTCLYGLSGLKSSC